MPRWIDRRRKWARPQESAAWLTTSVIIVTGFLWYLLHLLSANSLQCELHYLWWFQREETGQATLQWSSLLIMSLAGWFCAVVVVPKVERVPFWIRFWQGMTVGFLVLLMVLQWGQWRPQGPDRAFYDFFYEDVLTQPVINGVFYRPDPIEIMEAGTDWAGRVDLDHPAFDEFHRSEKEYREVFAGYFGPRGHARHNGRLMCSANRVYRKQWWGALGAYYADLAAEEQAQAREAEIRRMFAEPPATD